MQKERNTHGRAKSNNVGNTSAAPASGVVMIDAVVAKTHKRKNSTGMRKKQVANYNGNKGAEFENALDSERAFENAMSSASRLSQIDGQDKINKAD